MFQVVLVTLLGQRDRLAVPGLPFSSLISGYQQNRVPPGIEDIQDADLAAPSGAWPPTTTFKLTGAPTEARTGEGWVVTTGFRSTFNVAGRLVVDPKPLETLTV